MIGGSGQGASLAACVQPILKTGRPWLARSKGSRGFETISTASQSPARAVPIRDPAMHGSTSILSNDLSKSSVLTSSSVDGASRSSYLGKRRGSRVIAGRV